MWVLVLQRLVLEFVLDLFYFPLWWYTGGLKKVALSCARFWQDGNLQMSPGLWLKNIFVPMYGQYDWQSRLVSFFIRLFNVIIRGLGLLLWTIFVCFLFSLWIVFPVFVAYMIFRSI